MIHGEVGEHIMKIGSVRPSLKAKLLVSASMIVLAVACSEVSAADLPPLITKAPAFVVKDEWSWWGEGGLTGRPGADPQIGLIPLGILNPGPGWEAAGGFDYKPGMWPPYHISMQFRYGQNGQGPTGFRGSGFPLSLVEGGGPFTSPFVAAANGSGDLKEDHWLVDFAVGRDFAL